MGSLPVFLIFLRAPLYPGYTNRTKCFRQHGTSYLIEARYVWQTAQRSIHMCAPRRSMATRSPLPTSTSSTTAQRPVEPPLLALFKSWGSDGVTDDERDTAEPVQPGGFQPRHLWARRHTCTVQPVVNASERHGTTLESTPDPSRL